MGDAVGVVDNTGEEELLGQAHVDGRGGKGDVLRVRVLDGAELLVQIGPREAALLGGVAEAEAKLYVTASDEVRAERRRAELGAPSLEPVLADLRARDARDAGRDLAPMVAAADALLLDTTDLSIDAAVAEAIAYVRSRLPGGA